MLTGVITCGRRQGHAVLQTQIQGCATFYPLPTNRSLPGMLWLSLVAAAADCLPHGPARGSPPADVSPPPGVVPVALPSAGLEVGRSPVRRQEAALPAPETRSVVGPALAPAVVARSGAGRPAAEQAAAV